MSTLDAPSPDIQISTRASLKESSYNVAARLPDGRLAVANTLCGTRAVLAEPAEALLTGAPAGDTDDEQLLVELAELGFLVSTDLDELALIEQRQQFDRTDPTRLELTIAPTLSCNLRCTYCYEATKPPVRMSEENEKDLVEFVAGRLDGVRELHVAWFGGEPLAATQSILSLSRSLLDLCTWRGVAYSSALITNGVLLTEELAADLADLRVRSVRITVDGPRDLHDLLRPTAGGRPTFDEVLAGVQVARRHFDTVVGINVGRSNVRRVPELLDQMASARLQDVSLLFARMVDPDMGDAGPEMPRARGVTLSVSEFADHEVELIAEAQELGFSVADVDIEEATPCSAVKPNHFVVEPRGQIKRCYTEVTDPTKNTGRLVGGELELSPLDDKWMDYRFLDDGCRACAYLPLCHGGCPKMRMNEAEKEREVCTPRKFNLAEMLRRGIA